MNNNIIVFKKVKHAKRITKERLTEIERITTNILSERHVDFWKNPCIDMVSIVKQDGFNVVPVSMPIDTTGCLLVSDNPLEYKRVIIVNKDFKNPENEKDIVFKESRFMTAHEYGHYMLHKTSDMPLYVHRDGDKQNNEKELEADYFARALLMPSKPFHAFYKAAYKMSNGDDSFTKDLLSLIFKVTKNEVNKRLEDLTR